MSIEFIAARSGLSFLALEWLTRARGEDSGERLPDPLRQDEYTALTLTAHIELMDWILQAIALMDVDETAACDPWPAGMPPRFLTWFARYRPCRHV